jgi:hypothetical protein
MPSGIILDQSDLDLAKEALRDVMRDGSAPAAARAAAARTMLELNGALGRNAGVPIDPSRPTSELSRGDLLAELASLDAANSGTG